MIFGGLNPDKIWHQYLVNLPTSPVYCSNFALKNAKSHFSTVLFVHTSDYLRYLRRKQTVTPFPPHLKNLTSLPCKMHKFFTFFTFFMRIKYHQSAIWTSCGSVLLRHGWISAQLGGQCSWSVAKKTESMYLCRRWSLWTFVVTLLAWRSICHTS